MPASKKQLKKKREEFIESIDIQPNKIKKTKAVKPVKAIKKNKEASSALEAESGDGVTLPLREAKKKAMIDQLDKIILQEPEDKLTHRTKLDYMKFKAELEDLKPKPSENHLHLHGVDVDELSNEQLLFKLKQLKLAKMSMAQKAIDV